MGTGGARGKPERVTSGPGVFLSQSWLERWGPWWELFGGLPTALCTSGYLTIHLQKKGRPCSQNPSQGPLTGSFGPLRGDSQSRALLPGSLYTLFSNPREGSLWAGTAGQHPPAQAPARMPRGQLSGRWQEEKNVSPKPCISQGSPGKQSQ